MVQTWSLHGLQDETKIAQNRPKNIALALFFTLVLVLVHILNALALRVSMIPHTPQSDLNASDSEGNKHTDA